jgi:cytochrome c-type biogenesis protein CcmH/NrfF
VVRRRAALALAVTGLLLALAGLVLGPEAAGSEGGQAEATAGGAGSAPAPEGWAYAVAREIMSPFCPGRTLAECPSPQAQTLRAWLLVQEAAGRSRAEVEAELLERYGDQILALPPARGFGLTAYAIPVAVFLAGGAVVALFLRRQTREARAEPRPRPAPLSPELERLVDAELEEPEELAR